MGIDWQPFRQAKVLPTIVQFRDPELTGMTHGEPATPPVRPPAWGTYEPAISPYLQCLEPLADKAQPPAESNHQR